MRTAPSSIKQHRNTKTLCQRHGFSLKPKDQRITRPHRFSLSFCDPNLKTQKTNPFLHEKSCLNCPVLNLDGSHASPAFVLQSQRCHYLQQRETLRLQHELRVRYYSEEKSEVLVPKPKSRNNYCSVCRNNYEDYLDHISAESHKEKIKKSPFNAHVLQLARKVQQQAEWGREGKMEKQIDITQISDSQGVEVVESPRKRVKEDSPTLSNYNQSQMTYLQTNHPMAWITQAPLPSTAQISAYITQQMTLSHYLSMLQSPFPLISPPNHIQSIPYPIFPLGGGGGRVCIVIDD